MKASHFVKSTLAATFFLASFSLAYAGDAEVDADVNQEIKLQDIEISSASGEVDAAIGSLEAMDGSSVEGELNVEVEAKSIELDTDSGKVGLDIGGVSAGQSND